jgi:hypothetical protein
VSTPREPGLDHLISVLTADGHPAELAGRDAALAAFRAASQSPRRAPRRSPLGRMPARLGAVVAAGAAALAGVTAAAYAQALPAPVQHIAHTVFAVVGVPNSQPQQAGTGHSGRTTPAAGQASTPGSASRGAGCPCPATTSATPSPTTTTAHVTLTLSAARVLVPAYAVDVFTGRVTGHGRPAAGVTVQLLERSAGSATWRLAASGKTGPHGRFRLLTPRLTATSAFRVSGPGRSHSASVRVTVGARVRLKLVTGKVSDHLIVTARAARPGDMAVLEERVAGSWTRVTSQPLGAAYQASFPVAAKTAAAHNFRGVLLIAGFRVPSAAVWVPRPKHTGATIVVGPSPSPTATPTLTSMPSPTTTVAAGPTTTDSATPAPTDSAPQGGPPAPSASSSPAPATTPTGSAAPTGSPDPTATSPDDSQSARFL